MLQTALALRLRLLCSALLALFQYHDRNIFRVRYEVINHKHLLFIRKILHL
ncbi:hypothetical protein [Escherichia coli IS1]|nr:hypothetical protein [Escherichia coli IS1]